MSLKINPLNHLNHLSIGPKNSNNVNDAPELIFKINSLVHENELLKLITTDKDPQFVIKLADKRSPIEINKIFNSLRYSLPMDKLEHLHLDDCLYDHKELFALINSMQLKSLTLENLKVNSMVDYKNNPSRYYPSYLDEMHGDFNTLKKECDINLAKDCIGNLAPALTNCEQLTFKNCNWMNQNIVEQCIKQLPSLKILNILGDHAIDMKELFSTLYDFKLINPNSQLRVTVNHVTLAINL